MTFWREDREVLSSSELSTPTVTFLNAPNPTLLQSRIDQKVSSRITRCKRKESETNGEKMEERCKRIQI